MEKKTTLAKQAWKSFLFRTVCWRARKGLGDKISDEPSMSQVVINSSEVPPEVLIIRILIHDQETLESFLVVDYWRLTSRFKIITFVRICALDIYHLVSRNLQTSC
ncbi:uncharacterized protein LOC111311618 [Durio zibethinus]|uniref:Uncharacterized protein LOC111311618 n=1 Tax=Durio zibethinus TaxID=66656 RepID=A0A6P6APR4_DURZI|nr:uncharacterized protein LOC111311618 [Durio zibethinus]